MRKIEVLVLTILLALGTVVIPGCSSNKYDDLEDVTILYVNDSHSHINNQVTDDSGDVTGRGLSYASAAAMKKELADSGENVILADGGDIIQGTSYGGLDKGTGMQKILDCVGIDVATVGNHEFDYGAERLLEIIDSSKVPFVSCNWYGRKGGEPRLDAYKVIETGNVKVAFVGITTPDTLTTTSPVNLQDENGEYTEDFCRDEDGSLFYEKIQSAIDSASEEADYVVALGHLGNDDAVAPYRSSDVIANTTGLIAFIDGHSHEDMEGDVLKDKDGNDVVLTQAGSYLNYIGKMNISKGRVSTELIDKYDGIDETVDEVQNALIKQVDDKLDEVIASTGITFYMNEPGTETRIVRKQESNLGDLTTDSFYWYFNELYGLDCDVAINNGGNCRNQVEPGKLTYQTCKDIMPFGNPICLLEVTGQQIKDALEWGSRLVGQVNEDGTDVENGGFVQVAGLKYTIDTSVENTVVSDENNSWASGPEGEYRVNNIMVYNRDTQQYKDLDTKKTYTLAGVNFQLMNGGDGFTMFSGGKLITDFVTEEYAALAEYMMNFRGTELKTENSPLKKYSNYLIDYENAHGAGRITVK